MKPSVGSIVHYVSYGTPGGEYESECRAAIVTELPQGVADPVTVGLCVLSPAGQFFSRSIPRNDGHGEPPFTSPDRSVRVPGPLCGGKWYPGGTWHWPGQVTSA